MNDSTCDGLQCFALICYDLGIKNIEKQWDVMKFVKDTMQYVETGETTIPKDSRDVRMIMAISTYNEITLPIFLKLWNTDVVHVIIPVLKRKIRSFGIINDGNCRYN